MELKDFVNYHQKVIDMTLKLNKLFSFVIFIEFMLLSILLCVTAFQVVMSDDLLRIMTAFFHGMAAFMDLLIYSYGGQKVMDCSAEVCDDCEKIDDNYVFISMRAQKELRIKSMMFHATLPTFTLILSRTMSLITLLQSFL